MCYHHMRMKGCVKQTAMAVGRLGTCAHLLLRGASHIKPHLYRRCSHISVSPSLRLSITLHLPLYLSLVPTHHACFNHSLVFAITMGQVTLLTAWGIAVAVISVAAKPKLEITSKSISTCGQVDFKYSGGEPPYTVYSIVSSQVIFHTTTPKHVELTPG